MEYILSIPGMYILNVYPGSIFVMYNQKVYFECIYGKYILNVNAGSIYFECKYRMYILNLYLGEIDD